MEKNLKDYLPFYIGAYVYVFTPESITDGFLTKYLKDYPDGQYKIKITIDDLPRIIENGYQPILYPLSSVGLFKRLALTTGFDEKSTFEKKAEAWADCINKMRGAQIDCDGLIAAGIALDATLFPPNH